MNPVLLFVGITFNEVFKKLTLPGSYSSQVELGMNLCLQAPKRSKERLLKLASQSKHPLTEKQTREIWYINTMDYYSSIKKNKSCHLHQHGWT